MTQVDLISHFCGIRNFALQYPRRWRSSSHTRISFSFKNIASSAKVKTDLHIDNSVYQASVIHQIRAERSKTHATLTVILLALFRAATQSFMSVTSLAWRKYCRETALMTAQKQRSSHKSTKIKSANASTEWMKLSTAGPAAGKLTEAELCLWLLLCCNFTHLEGEMTFNL